MLVLSRRVDQKVSFPGLGISVQILGIKGSSVKVGIEAPLEIRVIREELAGQDTPAKTPDAASLSGRPRTHVIRLPQALRHELRNQLNTLSIALHLFKQQVDAGELSDAEDTFDRLVDHLERLAQGEVPSRENKPAPASRPCRALLVEDQDNERVMLAGILRMRGYEVVTACDGVEALEYLQSHEIPDVVLIDMRMPRLDGPTTIRRIRANQRYDRTKLFAISGCQPPEVGIDTQRDGVDRWFSKPLNPRSLVDAIMEEVEPLANCSA